MALTAPLPPGHGLSRGGQELFTQAFIAAAHAEEQYNRTGEAEGNINCPICGGGDTLHYIVSTTHHSYWIDCSTLHCVRFHADGKYRTAGAPDNPKGCRAPT